LRNVRGEPRSGVSEDAGEGGAVVPNKTQRGGGDNTNRRNWGWCSWAEGYREHIERVGAAMK
jgi:hypothetical protein